MQESPYNLFNNFQSTLLKAVKLFLSEKRNSSDKLIATSLRIPNEIKEFYDCIASADSTSLNTAILNTLTKVKDHTIREYQDTHSKINDIFYYQLESLLKIIDTHQIDYNDLCALLEWATEVKVSRACLVNKEKLVQIIDKKSQLKLCQMFGFSYDWVQDNNQIISYRENSHNYYWHRNVKGFIHGVIHSFYLDDTVQSFELSFLCCDRNLIKNILSGINPEKRELITPIVIANRRIHGVNIRTYHRFQSEDINYEECRKYFIALIKLIFMLKRHEIIDYPSGYVLTQQQNDIVLNEKIPLVTLFNTTHLPNALHLESLTTTELAEQSNDLLYTDKPHIYHVLNASLLKKISQLAKTADTIELTSELASQVDLSQPSLEKYLQLFDKDFSHNQTGFILCASKEGGSPLINIRRVNEVSKRMEEMKMLDDCF